MKGASRLKFVIAGLIAAALAASATLFKGVNLPINTTNPPSVNNPVTQVVKIGVVLPLTGSNASLGEGQKLGMKLALDKSKQSGHPVEMVFEDSQGKPDIAVSSVKKLLDFQNVNIQVLSTSNVAKATLPLYKQSGNDSLVMVQATLPNITKDYPFAYRIYQTANQEVDLLTSYAKKKKYLRIGALHFKNRSAEEAVKLFQKEIVPLGGQLVATESFSPTDKDIRPIIQKLKALNLDAILIYSLPTYYPLIANQIDEMKLEVPVLANSSVAIGKFDGGVSSSFLKRAVFPATRFYMEKNNPLVQELTKKIKDAGGEETQDVAYFYDMTNLLVKAIQSSASTKPQDIGNAMLKLTPYEGATGTIKFNEFRDAQPLMRLARFGEKGIEISE
jgi:branched-chain amino acid transport system substrate-binding protein